MDSDGVFRVESIQRGGGAQTRDGVPPHEHIESRQAAQQVRLLCRVDPVPNANEAAVFHLDVELLGVMTVSNCAVVANPPAFSRIVSASVGTVRACEERLALTSHRWG